jgi:hypothetical protein
VIDPNIDEAREHLLQSLLVAGVVEQFGFVAGGPTATQDAPRRNLTQDPYFSDGLRLVAMLGDARSTPLDEVDFLDWRRSADPLQHRGAPAELPPASGQSREDPGHSGWMR